VKRNLKVNNSTRRGIFKLLWVFLFSFFVTRKTKADLIISDFEKSTGFRNYGLPSKFEKIFRWIIANPSLKGNGVSYTPLNKLSGSLVPNGLHFERHQHGVKEINPELYELVINCFNKKEKFSLKRLRSFEFVTHKTFIECGGNSNVLYNKEPIKSSVDHIHGLFSVSEWTGIVLKDLLKSYLNKINKNTWLEFTSYDKGNYNISLPLIRVLDKAILCLYQNGEPIRPEQGYPVRLVIPGFEGSTHVKWLRKISFRNGPVFSRNETSRYTDLLPNGKSRQFSFVMELKSTILQPTHGDVLKKGKIVISGLAWSGDSNIKQVEVSKNSGKSWKSAKIDEKKSKIVRFFYSFEWNGEEIILQSRCIDENNKIQPSRKEFLKKMGYNAYYHFNGITSWKINSDGSVEHVYV